jgi:hypothetical protein
MRAARNFQIIRVFFILFTVCFISMLAQAKYGGGTGEPNNPYLIFTAEQLNTIGTEPNDWDKHFQLMADIDLSGFDGRSDRPAFNVIAPDTNEMTPEFEGPSFTGVFEGNGCVISNLTIAGGSHLGLFGRLSCATVRNLGIADANIIGSGSFIGGLAGTNDISDVVNCYATVTISGGDCVGGLVGDNEQGYVINCYSSGLVCGDLSIGGLAGVNNGTLINSYSIGLIGGNEYAGDLVGENNGDIINSFWGIEISDQTGIIYNYGNIIKPMQTSGMFLDSGWDFMDETENGTEDVWWILEGQDYPRLWWEAIDDGNSDTLSENPVLTGNESDIGESASEIYSDTSDAGEYFTEKFTSGLDAFDLTNKSVTFTPTTDGSYYSFVVQEITQLPTNPAGGKNLELSDDSYVSVSLSGPKKVQIFGYSYTRFYVGSNGYITFTRGDTSRNDIFTTHFNTKRISVLLDDFDPSRSGVVSWKQLEDRAVVTWENISEFTPVSSNTFQVEMYFDGKIRLAWLDIATTNGIVGLSKGGGVPENFQETDFSEYVPTQPDEGETPSEPGSGSGRKNRKK